MQLKLANNYSQDISSHKNDKAVVLFLGLALWVFIPILGIFPLIFFIHLNQKSRSKLNVVVTLLVILTITIFVSSADIISDLAVYVDNYGNLATKNPFEISGALGIECLLWLVSYPIYILSNGSNYAFVFFWSFLANALTFFVIAKGFSSRNYGLLLLFIVSNPIYIGFQGFLVRQYFANLIFLIAIINIDRKPVMWGLYVLSLLAHLANLIYLPFLLLYDKVRLLKNKVVVVLMVALGVALPFSSDLVVNLSERVAGLLPGDYSMLIVGKTAYYAREIVNESSFIVPLIEHLLILIIIFVLVKNQNFKTAKERLIYFLYPIFYVLMYLGKDIDMFSNRVAFLLFPFGGLFYYFAIDHQWKIFKKPILVLIFTIKIMYFNYYLYDISLGKSEFHYLNDQIYNSTIIDYIEVAIDNFTEDVKIKEKPTRRLS
ncbi:MAG: EpsG family protein [Pleurocapsa sp.]